VNRASRNKQRQISGIERALYKQLQASFQQRNILLKHQQMLKAKLDTIYQELTQVALTDEVTGLANRRAVMSTLREVLVRADRTQEIWAVLFVDLDQFKRVNDTWGHRVGDWLLQEVAHRLRLVSRGQDSVGRYGGEEFVILVPQVNAHTALLMAEAIYSTLTSSPYFWQTEAGVIPIFIGASIGVALSPRHGTSAEALIEAADRAMYRAKNTGGGICFAESELSISQTLFSRCDHTKSSVENAAAQVLKDELTVVITSYEQQTEVILNETNLSHVEKFL